MPPTSAIAADASPPCPLSLPISRESALRRACSSSVRVCSDLRSASSALKRATSRNGCGELARLEPGDDLRKVLAQQRNVEHGAK